MQKEEEEEEEKKKHLYFLAALILILGNLCNYVVGFVLGVVGFFCLFVCLLS